MTTLSAAVAAVHATARIPGMRPGAIRLNVIVSLVYLLLALLVAALAHALLCG
ncbi:MAG: hypothetical protein ABEJ76_07890 [Halanaeroarchaeum sp.]